MKTYFHLILIFIGFLVISCKNNHEKSNSKNESDGKSSTISENNQDKLNSNKILVLEFYQQFFGDKDLSAADRYLGETYIQHNPGVPNGKEALKKLFEPIFRNAPKTKVDIRRVAADGNLVWLHIKGNMGDKEIAIVDIFRIENNKIVEHWDVIQEVPAKPANNNTMF